MVVVLIRLIPEEAKDQIRAREAAKDDNKGEDHRFPADRLDEGVENFREGVCGDTGAADFVRVAVHALAPVLADGFQCRGARRSIAFVGCVLLCASSHLCHDIRHRFEGLLVHVPRHCGPEAVDEVRASCQQEDVEDELGVEG